MKFDVANHLHKEDIRTPRKLGPDLAQILNGDRTCSYLQQPKASAFSRKPPPKDLASNTHAPGPDTIAQPIGPFTWGGPMPFGPKSKCVEEEESLFKEVKVGSLPAERPGLRFRNWKHSMLRRDGQTAI